MPLTLYNSLTKKEEVFEPFHAPEVTMYTCGPTVYGRPHIGNYSSFLMADLLRRWLEAGHNYTVKHVKNITDVGHLVADADEGEDKVEKQARQESGEVTHESVIAIARKYEAEYLADEDMLNMVQPEERPRATDYIQQMKDMIDALLESGFAYITDDGVYFNVMKSDDYGKLSGNTLDNLSAGARVQVNDDKRHPADFALWKFCVGNNEHHALRWSSPGQGNPDGFPGWHIECSAMSSSLLGDQIDIHTGGEDNIFPHHECEIAQSECVTGKKPFVKHWLHRRRIDMGDQKMSKSIGNVLSLDDIKDMGYSPLDLRYLFLSVHYRTQLKFNEKGLKDARIARLKISEWVKNKGQPTYLPSKFTAEPIARDQYTIQGFIDKFNESMNSDLNTPGALAAVFECITYTKKTASISSTRELLESFTKIVASTFGCFDEEVQEEVPTEVLALAEERVQARANKDFVESDRLRDAMKELGYEARDGADGQTISKL